METIKISEAIKQGYEYAMEDGGEGLLHLTDLEQE